MWRDRRKLSAQALSDRITELGGSLSGIAIRRIENGERGVSLEEWLLLSHALAVPPALLFLDLQSGEKVAVAPGATLHPWLIWQWVTGAQPPVVNSESGIGGMVARVEEWHAALTSVRLYQEEEKAADRVRSAVSDVRRAAFVGDDTRVKAARAEYVDALAGLAAVFDEMVENDITPPGKSPEWIALIREHGMSKYPDRLVAVPVHGEGVEDAPSLFRPVTPDDVPGARNGER